jgi:polysaccharide export outer membrane protein
VWRFRISLLLFCVSTLPFGAADAQAAPMTNDRLRELIRQTGLSADEIRRRAAAAGVDSLALQAVQANDSVRARGSAMADPSMVAGLAAIGVVQGLGGTTSTQDTLRRAIVAPQRDSLRMGRSGVGIFGSDVFGGAASRFEPVVGLADPSYRLGSGDAIQIVMTGDVEQAYSLEVRNDGSVILPKFGVVPVAGLTVEAAATLLRSRGARAYSGLSQGRIRLDLSISRARQNVVFVLGEVERPGPVRLPAVGTSFQAIAVAGGPSVNGSYQRIQLRRVGRLVRTIDLYEYLLEGDGSADMRLEHGDVLFVPTRGRAVSITGAVYRPRQFELLDGESLQQSFRFAGGFLAEASVDCVEVDRIVPPKDRKPGYDRTVLSISLRTADSTAKSLPVEDGDVVRVSQVGGEARNAYRISGAVFSPGRYEWREGLTLSEAVARAKGLEPWAESERIKVSRLDMGRLVRQYFSLDVSMAEGRDWKLAEYDVIEVLDRRVGTEQAAVDVDGAVNRPRSLPFAAGYTLQDALSAAGGAAKGAQFVEVTRLLRNRDYSDSTASVVRFQLDSLGRLPDRGASVLLAPGDHISVRLAAGIRQERTVEVIGRFVYPGIYSLLSEREPLSSVVARAGGLLPNAYPESFRLIRNGRVVAVPLDTSVRRDPSYDQPLEGGDQMSVEADPGLVDVSGSVYRPASIPFRRGWSMRNFIDAAGGVRSDADTKRIFVEYANGTAQPRRTIAWLFRNDPAIRSGAAISVPPRPPRREGTFREAFSAALQTTTALTSVLVAVLAVSR